MKVSLKPAASSKVAISEGTYHREFAKGQQPFDVTAREAAILARTGLFDQVTEVTETKEVDKPL